MERKLGSVINPNAKARNVKQVDKLWPRAPSKNANKHLASLISTTITTTDVFPDVPPADPPVVVENQESTYPESSVCQQQQNLLVPNPTSTISGSSSPLLLTPKRSSRNPRLSFDKMRECKLSVDKAVKEGKIFIVQGSYPAIRAALKSRGWLEKIYTRSSKEKDLSGPSKDSKNVGEDTETKPSGTDVTNSWIRDDFVKEDYLIQSQVSLMTAAELAENALISRLLKDCAPNLIWTVNRDFADWRCLTKNQTINRFSSVPFTTKVGLSQCVRDLHWTGETCNADSFFPRCYQPIHDEADLQAWVEDYRLTACISLLKWIVENPKYVRQDVNAKAALHARSLEFAFARVADFVQCCNQEDLDQSPTRILLDDWNEFLDVYYELVHRNGLFYCCQEPADIVVKTKLALEKARPFWPQLSFDGTLNVWILKPGALSRGRGIHIHNELSTIVELLKSPQGKENKFVVQKYIERPMLIRNTKFDIRQWFLVTDWNPLTVWMYKEAYLRFCSQPFSLENLHESIHLCNNAIQCRYMSDASNSSMKPALPCVACGGEDPQLSPEHMWYQKTFQEHLAYLGHASAWQEIIVPAMREALIGVLLAAQEDVGVQKKGFELYGADFMLTPDLQVWLIEINACPCMAPSTSVTADLCAKCLEDIIKVVVDWRDDKTASTGQFELVYKQVSVPAPQYSGLDLTVVGHAIPGSFGVSQQPRQAINTKLKPVTVHQPFCLPKIAETGQLSILLNANLPSPVPFRQITTWHSHMTTRVRGWVKNSRRNMGPRLPVRSKYFEQKTPKIAGKAEQKEVSRASKFAQTVSGAILVRGTQKRLLCSPDRKSFF